MSEAAPSARGHALTQQEQVAFIASLPERLPSAELLIARDLPPGADGSWRRQAVVRTDLRYPLLRVEDRLRLGASGEERLERSIVVADHVLVDLAADDATAPLLEGPEGLHLRRRTPDGRMALIAFDGLDLDAMARVEAWLTQRTQTVARDQLLSVNIEPDDPDFIIQNALEHHDDIDIDATAAWDIHTGSRATLVGVIDSGIQMDHPDLAANIFYNQGEMGLDADGNDRRSNGLDDDGNGYIDDWRGWDFYTDENNPTDLTGHGTHVAGTIGAVGNNGVGVSGVCWQVSLVALKASGSHGFGFGSAAIEATRYATALGCDLTNNSYGSGGINLIFKDALAEAGAAGMLVVAAAGNNSRDSDAEPFYPASYDLDNIISVGAHNFLDTKSSFSNFGLASVDLMAPGSGIYSTFDNDFYGSSSGTSMASPHVAGACALLRSARPDLDAAAIKAAILDSVVVLPQYADYCQTGGRLNLAAAMHHIIDAYLRDEAILVEELGDGDGIHEPGEAVAISITLKSTGTHAVVDPTPSIIIDDAAVTIEALPEPPGDLPIGSSVTLTWRCRIAADASTPNEITVRPTMSSGDDSWSWAVPLTIEHSVRISGQVTRSGSGAPLADATISSADGDWVAISEADGTYALDLPAGRYELRCTADALTTVRRTGLDLDADRSLDWQLGRPGLSTDPSLLSLSVRQGHEGSASFTLSNPGDVALNQSWSLTYGVLLPEPLREGQWHRSNLRDAGLDGSAWYCGDDSLRTYANASTVDLTFAAVELPANPRLVFSEFLEVEERNDLALVEISADGLTWETIRTRADKSEGWRHVSIDLSGRPSPCWLRFRFHSDEFVAEGEGWFVDEIAIVNADEVLPDRLPLIGAVSPPGSALAPGAEESLTLRLIPELQTGSRSATLVARTNIDDGARVLVPVEIEVLPWPRLAGSLRYEPSGAGSSSDGDSYFEPGETWRLELTLVNHGGAAASGIDLTTSCDLDSATLAALVSPPTTLAAGATATAVWTLTLPGELPPDTDQLSCEIIAVSAEGWSETVSAAHAVTSPISVGIISGTLLQAGRPIPNVEVAYSGPGGYGKAPTDAEGCFVYPDIPVGTYLVTANLGVEGEYIALPDVEVPDSSTDLALELPYGLIRSEPTAVDLTVTDVTTQTLEIRLDGSLAKFAHVVEALSPTVSPEGPWHVSHRRSVDGRSWYCGDEATGLYTSLAIPDQGLLFGPIDIPPGAENLSWQEFLEMADYDSATVAISSDGGASWTEVHNALPTEDAFLTRSLDVSAQAGGQLWLRFAFDSPWPNYGDYEGWYIDDLRLDGTALEELRHPWLSIGGERVGNTAPDDPLVWTLTIDPSGLSDGLHTGSVLIHSDDTRDTTLEIPVRISVGEPEPPAILVSSNSVSVPEGGTAEVTVQLSKAPTDSVVVTTERTSGDTDLSVTSGATLTFSATNWSIPQNLVLAAAIDADEADHEAVFTLSAAGLDDTVIVATEDDAALPQQRQLRIGTDDPSRDFHILEPAAAPSGSGDGTDTVFEGLDRDTDYRLAPTLIPGADG